MTRYELGCMLGRRGLWAFAETWLHFLRIPNRRVCDRMDAAMEPVSRPAMVKS